MTAMEIRDLVIKVDGYPVVDGLTLTVEEEERVGIVGDFRDALLVMNVLCGLSLPDSGEIWIYNMPPRQAFQRGFINYIRQHHSETAIALPVPVLLVTRTAIHQPYNTSVVIHPVSYIEISDEFIHNNYKFINLEPERRSKLS
ncbi:MAG: hypothetical protein N3B10_02290 [Armatimonadetes bacterium]|nr:hypothetical protein [Armatimonadota bacterium]MCX7967300.1 hypothetical protein [Armatimonadota bacterium]MDW8143304.1 hypothetical protein [Armatimonadota bacterium]